MNEWNECYLLFKVSIMIIISPGGGCTAVALQTVTAAPSVKLTLTLMQAG